MTTDYVIVTKPMVTSVRTFLSRTDTRQRAFAAKVGVTEGVMSALVCGRKKRLGKEVWDLIFKELWIAGDGPPVEALGVPEKPTDGSEVLAELSAIREKTQATWVLVADTCNVSMHTLQRFRARPGSVTHQSLALFRAGLKRLKLSEGAPATPARTAQAPAKNMKVASVTVPVVPPTGMLSKEEIDSQMLELMNLQFDIVNKKLSILSSMRAHYENPVQLNGARIR